MISSFQNVNSYFDYSVFTSMGVPLTVEDLFALPPSLARVELCRDNFIPIPSALLSAYNKFRPTPIFRATAFEKAIGTNCHIYIKDEGRTPSGNHKMNSALFVAYRCRQDGVETVTTETTGNWGVALAKAAADFGLATICFIDYASHKERPDRKGMMERAGASVVVVGNDYAHTGLLSLSADAAIRHTLTLRKAAYIFGSVYGYFLIPQSLVGLEAKCQLEEMALYPDIVVGSCGGGANLMGIAVPFIVDHVESKRTIEIVSAEAADCPILTRGKVGVYGIDTFGYYPSLRTHGLEEITYDGNYIGGLGSSLVASAVSYFYALGVIKAHAFTAEEAKCAANLFRDSEGRRVAIETAYILAGAIYMAKVRAGKKILLSISSVGPTVSI